MVGTELRKKVADNIKHIVTPDAQKQLDYSLYKAKVDALYSQFPDLGISDKIWVLFQLGAQFLVSSVEDKDVLVKFPGQAAHEIGLDKHPKEMVCQFVKCVFSNLPLHGAVVWCIVYRPYSSIFICQIASSKWRKGVCYARLSSQ